MSKRFASVVMVACVASLVCSLARAAEVAGRPWILGAAVSGEYTDNRDSVEFNKQSTFDLYIRPRLDVLKYTEQNKFNLYYVPELRLRSDAAPGQDDASLFHDFGAMWLRNLSERATLRVEDRFRYTDDSSAKNGSSTIRSNQKYIQNTLDGVMNFDVMEYSNLDLWGTWYLRNYDEAAASVISDEELFRLQALLRWKLNESLSSSLMARGDMNTYDNTQIDRDSTILTGSAGLRNQFSEYLAASVSAGALGRSYSDSSISGDGDVLPYGQLVVEYKTLAATSLNLEANLGARDSDVYPFASQEYVETRIGFDWENETGRIMLDADLLYRVSSYDADQLPSAVRSNPSAYQLKSIDGDENTIAASVGAHYKFVDHASIRLSQRYEDVDSDVSTSYTKNTTVASLNVDF